MKPSICYEMEPEELAKYFKYKNWEYASPDLGYGPPDANTFGRLLSHLYNQLMDMGWEEDDYLKAVDRGRFMVTRYESDIFEGEGDATLGVWLYVGHMHDREGEDDLD